MSFDTAVKFPAIFSKIGSLDYNLGIADSTPLKELDKVGCLGGTGSKYTAELSCLTVEWPQVMLAEWCQEVSCSKRKKKSISTRLATSRKSA